MTFLFCPFPSVISAAKTVSHQSHVAKLGLSPVLTDLQGQMLGTLPPQPFSEIHIGMRALIIRLGEEPLFQHFCLLHTKDQATLPTFQPTMTFGCLVTFVLWHG